MYTAYYAPACKGEDPSQDGFEDEDAAYDWIRANYICGDCEHLIQLAEEWEKSGKKYPEGYEEWSDEKCIDWDMCNKGDFDPACMCEWFIIKTNELAQCETFGDILNTAGYKQVDAEGKQVG